MALECEYGLICFMLMLPVHAAVFVTIAIVKARILLRQTHVSEAIVGDRLTDIPHFQKLVLSI